jgi:HEAT repeat protein
VIHTQIIPQLLNQMISDTNDSSLRLNLVEWLNGLPSVHVVYNPAEVRRAQAVECIGELGPCASNTIPALIKAFHGTDTILRAPAARALGQIRSEPETILPLLIKAIDDPQDGVPESAIMGLGDFGAEASAALPKLMPLLKAPDKDIRHAATIALQRISPATNRPAP